MLKTQNDTATLGIPSEKNSSSSAAGSASWQPLLVVFLTAAVSLVSCHFRLLWYDEILVLWTSSVASLSQIVEIQRNFPVSLDPPLYHFIEHNIIGALGPGATAIRLSSLFGYLFMQICILLFVRRAADVKSGVLAMALTAITATLFYSLEARPYGLLLGAWALVMVAWQAVTRSATHRAWRLALLGIAIAISINLHYYGFFILLPLCAAELLREFRNRRVDFHVLSAVVCGAATIVCLVPFLKAASMYRVHYWNTDLITPVQIQTAYLSILFPISVVQYHAALGSLIAGILLAVCIWGFIRHIRKGTLLLRTPEAVFLVTLALLPVFGYVLSKLFTNAYEPRYVLGAVLGIAALLSIALTSFLPTARAYNLGMAAIYLAIVLLGIARVQAVRRDALRNSPSVLSPQTRAALLASPTKLLYYQDDLKFAVASYYETDPDVRSRLALTYSTAQEMRWSHANTASLSATNMARFLPLKVVPYESLISQPGEHLFVTFHRARLDWTDQAFQNSHAQLTHLGTTFDGDIEAVRFLQ